MSLVFRVVSLVVVTPWNASLLNVNSLFPPGSVCDSEDELSPEWEEISPTDEQLEEYKNDFSTSTATLMSPGTDSNSVSDSVDNTKLKLQSTQLSAETVAKSLLLKFANRKHPAASELQWLVSYQDAPQSLLPLPDTVAVAPDDVLQIEALEKKPVFRQNSLPVSTEALVSNYTNKPIRPKPA